MQYITDGFRDGFKMGFDRYPEPREPCPNSRHVRLHPKATRKLIQAEIQKGHILGPFDTPPVDGMVYSPLNIVPKAGSQKESEWRLIHNFTFPYNNQSINSCIPPENASIQYHYIDEVIDMALVIGSNAWGARIDISHAFRNAAVHGTEVRLFGFTFEGKYYLNACMAFGEASSCFIFEKIATALQWIVSNVTGCHWISHFLDDFPLLERSRLSLVTFMDEFYRIMSDIGMPVAMHKTLGPTQLLEYLGLLLNFAAQTIEVSQSKRDKCLRLINRSLDTRDSHTAVTIKQIQ